MKVETETDTETEAEIRSSRLYAAGRGQIYAAFSDVSLLPRWWGPRGFSNTMHEFDLRPGGHWKFTMHAPDGQDYPNHKHFTHVLPGQRVEFDHVAPVHRFHMSLDLSDQAGGTLFSWVMKFEDPEDTRKLRSFITTANEENLERLESLLAELPADQDSVLERCFDVPRERVFAAWTRPDLLAQWWGPHAFTNPVCEVAAEKGRDYRMVMRSPDGTEYPLKGTFLQVTPPWQMAFTMDCSEHPPQWHDVVKPGRTKDDANPAGLILTTVTFIAEAEDRTRVLLRQRFESPEIYQSFMRMEMHSGWNESFDALAALLANGHKKE